MVELIKKFSYDKSYLFGKRGIYFRLTQQEVAQIRDLIIEEEENEKIQRRRLDKGKVEGLRDVSSTEGVAEVSTEKSSDESSVDQKGSL